MTCVNRIAYLFLELLVLFKKINIQRYKKSNKYLKLYYQVKDKNNRIKQFMIFTHDPELLQKFDRQYNMLVPTDMLDLIYRYASPKDQKKLALVLQRKRDC